MNDYSDVLQVMGAMLLVSLLIQTANRSNVANTRLLIESEYEIAVTAIAQDIMEESRTLAFDETTEDGFVPVNIPADFSNVGADGAENAAKKSEFDDFDDYDNWSTTVTNDLGDFSVSVRVYYVDSNFNPSASKTTLKELLVTITSPFLVENDGTTLKSYNFKLVRSYYAE
jgi:hypothetical protein